MSIAAEVYEADRRVLWGLCYRMTGSAADADDLVQETFVRAMESPPRRADEPLRPWLVRVAMNLSRDHLRRRKRRDYPGEWLPWPIPTDDAEKREAEAPASYSPAARYDLRESLSFAFLLALEALTPAQRAALLLRDVLDYSTAEAAAALRMTEANLKVHLHRARRRMREYDKGRAVSSWRADETRAAIERFLACLSAGDVECIEKLLTEDALSFSDGGGKVPAAMQPVVGRHKVARLIAGLATKFKSTPEITFQSLNGLPALMVNVPRQEAFASRFTIHFEIDGNGMIRRLYSVLSPEKLSAIE